MEEAARKSPITIEFTGTPEAGKTTQLTRISRWLCEEGFHVVTIRESAEIVPLCFKKGSVEANRWIRLKTTEELLCSNETNADVVMVDRGLVDGMIWQEIFFHEEKISHAEMEAYRLWVEQFMFQPDLLLAFFLSPELSIKRRGGEGKIATKSFIAHYNRFVQKFLDSYSGKFLNVDASLSCEEVTRLLMDIIRNILPC